ncbi:MAG: hypothetical protein KDM91_23290 [Verrucomicrobiae bacterium]|nr:hypothetical protein [Verrucomicrobiae bacterium]
MKARTEIEAIASRYLKWVRWSEEDECYVGSIPDLCGDCCHGDDEALVYAKLVSIAEDLVADFLEKGQLPRISARLQVAEPV